MKLKWIPNESEKSKPVNDALITYVDRFSDGSGTFNAVAIAMFNRRTKKWEDDRFTYDTVVAWMPLPEPYEIETGK